MRIHGLHVGHQRLRLVDHGLTGWNAGRHIRLGQYLQGFKKALQGRGDANVRVGNDAIQLIQLSFLGGVVAFHCCIGLHHFSRWESYTRLMEVVWHTVADIAGTGVVSHIGCLTINPSMIACRIQAADVVAGGGHEARAAFRPLTAIPKNTRHDESPSCIFIAIDQNRST